MTIVIPQSGAEVVVTPGTLESVGTPWRQLPFSIWGSASDQDGVLTGLTTSGNLYTATLNRALSRTFLQRGNFRAALLEDLDALQDGHRYQFRIKLEGSPTGIAGSVVPYIVLSVGRGTGDTGWPNDGCHGGLRLGASGRRLLCHNNQQIDLVAAEAAQDEDDADLDEVVLTYSWKKSAELSMWASSLKDGAEQAFKPIASAALPSAVDRLVLSVGNMAAGAAGEVVLPFSLWQRQIATLVTA